MRVEKLGVIGAGLMGSGIAQVAAYHGCEVTLVDVDEERVARAIAGVRSRLSREAERGIGRSGKRASPRRRRYRFADVGGPRRSGYRSRGRRP
ncbi:MAG: hypothetical protein C4321_02455 [Chloroflexota bacterium]